MQQREKRSYISQKCESRDFYQFLLQNVCATLFLPHFNMKLKPLSWLWQDYISCPLLINDKLISLTKVALTVITACKGLFFSILCAAFVFISLSYLYVFWTFYFEIEILFWNKDQELLCYALHSDTRRRWMNREASRRFFIIIISLSYKFYIFAGKSLVFTFTFSFPYHSSDDRRLMIFILVQVGHIVDSRDFAYKFRFSH